MLTRPLGFDIDEAGAVRSPALLAAPGETLTDFQIASGRRWSTKVVLMSGVRASALHARDDPQFKVMVSGYIPAALATALRSAPATLL